MNGLWAFLIVAVVFGSLSSIIRAAINRRQLTAGEKELAELRSRVKELEGSASESPALPPHEKQRADELEKRVQSLETIVTGADELLEKRLRDAASQVTHKD